MASTLDALVATRSDVSVERPQSRCFDNGYDYDLVRYAAQARGYTLHLRTRGEERQAALNGDRHQRPRQWVVERLPCSRATAACSSASRSCRAPTAPLCSWLARSSVSNWLTAALLPNWFSRISS